MICTIYKYMRYVYVCIYTGSPILKVALKYFFDKAFSEKMFQTKVVWVEGRHKRVPLI